MSPSTQCHCVCYSPPRPQVGVSGPLVPGRGPSPAHPRLPWARLGACLQWLPQVNTEIRNPRATSLPSAPCPSACPGLGCAPKPPQVLPPHWRCALTHPSTTVTSVPEPPALARPCLSVHLLLSLSLWVSPGLCFFCPYLLSPELLCSFAFLWNDPRLHSVTVPLLPPFSVLAQ